MMHRLSDVQRIGLLPCALLGVLLSTAAFAVAPRLEVDARVRQDNGEVVQRSVAPGAVLRTGDDVRLRVTPWKDGYLYVVALGSSGSAVVLHPFAGPAEPVRAGESLAVPRDGGYLPLDSRTGRETLLAFVSDKPVESLSRLLVRLEAAGAAADGASLREVLASEGFEAAQLAFGHAPAAVAYAPTPAQTPAAGAVADSQQPAAPAVPSAPSSYEQPGVLSGLGSRIAEFTGKAPAAPAAPAAAAAQMPAPAPVATARAPGRDTRTQTTQEKPPSGILASLFGFGGADAGKPEPTPPPPSASTFPLAPVSDAPSERATRDTAPRAEPIPARVVAAEAAAAAPQQAPAAHDPPTTVPAPTVSAGDAVAHAPMAAPATARDVLPPPIREAPRAMAVPEQASQSTRGPTAASAPTFVPPSTTGRELPPAERAAVIPSAREQAPEVAVTPSVAPPLPKVDAPAIEISAAPAPITAAAVAETTETTAATMASEAPPASAPDKPTLEQSRPATFVSTDPVVASDPARGHSGQGESTGWLAGLGALFGGGRATAPQPRPEAAPEQPAIAAAPRDTGSSPPTAAPVERSQLASSKPMPPGAPGDIGSAPAGIASAQSPLTQSSPAPAVAESAPAKAPVAEDAPGKSSGLLASLGAFFSGGSRHDARAVPEQVQDRAPAAPTASTPRVNAGAEPILSRRVDESGRSVVTLEGAPPPRQASSEVLSESGSRIRALLSEPGPARTATVPQQTYAQPEQLTPPAPEQVAVATADPPPSAAPPAQALPQSRQAIAPVIEQPRSKPEPSAPSVPVPAADPVRTALDSGAAAVGSEAPMQLALLTAAPARAVAQAAEQLAQVDLASNSGAAGAVVMIVSPEGATSGVLVDSLGHVLTNWHSVRGYDALLVVFKQVGGTGAATATRSLARVVGHSKFSDLALLKVDALPSGIAPPALVSKVEVDSGSPIHAISPGDDGQWRHSVATVDRIRRNSSWYSAHRVLHRADVIRAEMADPRDVAGAPLFNNKLELVGLGAMVRTDKGELIGVSAGTVRAFLAAPG